MVLVHDAAIAATTQAIENFDRLRSLRDDSYNALTFIALDAIK